MERRIKLVMAAVALALLVAGAARRWAKEHDIHLATLVPRDASALHADGELPVQPLSRNVEPAHAPPVGEHQVIKPAAATFPDNRAFEIGGPQSDQSVIPAGFAPSQPAVIAAPPAADRGMLPEMPPATAPTAREPAAPAGDAPADSPPNAAPPGYCVVQSNDSFWSISQRVYGTGRYFHALYEYNRRRCPQPDRLPPGVVIETPEPHHLERAFPELFR
jgi:hypothetical protein